MSAAATATPEHPSLVGIPSAVQTPAPPATAATLDAGEPIKCCFIGHLAGPAIVRPHGTESVVEVLLHQHVPRHPQALPVLAAWHWPDHIGDALECRRRADALAAQLPAGAECTVLGRGLECSHHHGEPVLRVMHVLGLKPTES